VDAVRYAILCLLALVFIACGTSNADSTAAAEARNEEALANTYEQEVVAHLGNLSQGILAFGELAGRRADDAAWRTEVEDLLNSWTTITTEVRQLSVPQVYADLHAVLLQAMDDFDVAAEQLGHGFLRNDMNALQLGIAALESGNENVETARRMIPEGR
jgi:hypothetical protein